MAVSGDACNRAQMFGEKPSSRVLAQPGGNSSFSLGWGQPEPTQQRAAPVAKENTAPAQPTNVPPPQQPVKVTGATSSNAWASNSSQNSGNMISDRPTSRVLAPPGGKSSITF